MTDIQIFKIFKILQAGYFLHMIMIKIKRLKFDQMPNILYFLHNISVTSMLLFLKLSTERTLLLSTPPNLLILLFSRCNSLKSVKDCKFSIRSIWLKLRTKHRILSNYLWRVIWLMLWLPKSTLYILEGSSSPAAAIIDFLFIIQNYYQYIYFWYPMPLII